MQALIQGLGVPAVAVALQAALLMAQVQQSPPKGNRTISGTVVNSVTGDPIRRALVDIGGQHSALTDGDGHFEFHDLPDSQVFINVHKPGFFNEQEISSAPPPENSLVQAGTDPKAVIAKLVPEGVVFGRIGSESGPVEGQQVSLVASRVRDGVRRWERHGNATTDEEGTFRIAELMPGSYYLSVGPGDQNMLASGTPPRFHGYAQSFYPGVPGLGAATPVEVGAGQQVEADLAIKPVPVFEVSGTVSGFAPGTGVSLQFQTGSGELVAFAMRFDDSTGNFRTTVPVGSYVLKARAQSSNSGDLIEMDLPIDVTEDLRGLRLTLAPIAPIGVNVRAIGMARRPQRNASYVIGMNNSPSGAVLATVGLTAVGPRLDTPQYFAMPEGEGKNQRLTLKNVEPGNYQVEVQGAGEWYVAEVHCGATDLLHDGLEVHPGSRLPPIEVELRNDGGELRASVTSEGSPAAGWVLLVPSRAPAETQLRQASLNAQEIFQGLPPGEYSVLALDSVDGLEYKNPDALSEFMGKAAQVFLGPQQELETKLELVHRTR